MPDRFEVLRGISGTIFSLGIDGPNMKQETADIAAARLADDSDYGIFRCEDPIGGNDAVTLDYFNANNAAAEGVTSVRMPLALVTKVSSIAIPDNAEIVRAIVEVLTAYDDTPSLAITRTGDGAVEPHATGDSKLSKIGVYDVPQLQSWGATGAGTVTATISAGTPTVGVADIVIFYTTPTDIS